MASSNKATVNVDSLSEVFCCFICMERLKDARLCPHCSKLCCYACIRRWLSEQRQQCPHCRAPLRIHDLVVCRWIDEVTVQLDSLKLKELNQQREDKDKCELHKEMLTVYCSSCSSCICHKCALFNQTHTGHDFVPIDDVYETNVSVINQHMERLKQRQVELIRCVHNIERNRESIQIARDERCHHIQNFMYAVQMNLDQQCMVKINTLNVQHAVISRQTEMIEQTLCDIEDHMSASGKAEIIEKQQDLINRLRLAYDKTQKISSPIAVSNEFPSDIVPPYNSCLFRIEHFSILQNNVEPIYSQILHVNSLSWRLKVYPNGNGTVQGTYLSVFLELTHGLNESSKYEYRIEMIYQLEEDPSKNFSREFTSDFEVGECWGYNRYYLFSDLITEGFHNPNNDTLVLRFHVRSPTYKQESRDQQSYIKRLENNQQQLKNELRSLREKVRAIHLEANALNTDIMSTIAMTDVNEADDSDDEYTSIESDQSNSGEEENALTINEIETNDNLHSETAVQSTNGILLDSAKFDRAAVADLGPIHLSSNDSNATNETERRSNRRINDARVLNETLAVVSNEDLILANILHADNNNEQNVSTGSHETIHNNTDELTTRPNENLSYDHSQYQTSFNS